MRLAVLLALLPAVAAADPDKGDTTEVDAGAGTVVASYRNKTTVDPAVVFRLGYGRFLRSDFAMSLELSDTISLHPIDEGHEVENSLCLAFGAQVWLQRDVFVGASGGIARGTTNSYDGVSPSGYTALGRVGYVLSRDEASVKTASLAFTHTWLDPGPGSLNAIAVQLGFQFL